LGVFHGGRVGAKPDQADETRSFPNGVVEMVTIADTMIGRARFESGWRWSNSPTSAHGATAETRL
jgi:hypothetical protein